MSSMSPPGAATKVCYFNRLHYNRLDGAHWYYWTIKVYQSKTTPGAHLGRYSHCLCHTSRLHLKQVINYRSKMTKGSIQIMQQHDAIYHCNNFYSSWTRDHFRGTWFIESLSKVYSIEDVLRSSFPNCPHCQIEDPSFFFTKTFLTSLQLWNYIHLQQLGMEFQVIMNPYLCFSIELNFLTRANLFFFRSPWPMP